MHVDAIVNAANSTLLGGGGVDGAIHRAAGRGLLEECRTLGGCMTGEAKATGAYDLPAKYVIHTVGPVWHGGGEGEREALVSCYNNSLQLAESLGCQSIAFPLISAGVYGYPGREAFRVAEETIRAHLETSDIQAFIVLFDADSYSIVASNFGAIAAYIDDNYVYAHSDSAASMQERHNYALNMPYASANIAPAASAKPNQTDPEKPRLFKKPKPKQSAKAECNDACAIESQSAACADYGTAALEGELDDLVNALDESFSQMLLRKIDEKGITDAQCYKRANIDRKLFSKIRSDKTYRPSKPTALAFAIALELSLNETNELLMKAGFALSHSSKFDVIIEYFITHGNYNVYDINDALFAFDQPLLG